MSDEQRFRSAPANKEAVIEGMRGATAEAEEARVRAIDRLWDRYSDVVEDGALEPEVFHEAFARWEDAGAFPLFRGDHFEWHAITFGLALHAYALASEFRGPTGLAAKSAADALVRLSGGERFTNHQEHKYAAKA